MEPENGGLGVFSHEFAHDLGIPDYYDTQGGDNGTGFWTLMSRGSWMNHGLDNIGTTPDHMGAPDKLFLGWYGANDLAVVDGSGAPKTVNLGPSYHATSDGAQAVAVTLPQGHSTINVVAPDQGTRYLYSGNGNDRTATATGPSVAVPAGSPVLTARVSVPSRTTGTTPTSRSRPTTGVRTTSTPASRPRPTTTSRTSATASPAARASAPRASATWPGPT